MIDFIYEIIKIALAPSAVILVLVYFLKRYFDKEATKDLEQFKIKISHEAEIAINSIQNEMEKNLFEYQTRYSFYHNKLVEIIAKLYNLIVDANSQMIRLTATIQMVDGISLDTKKEKAIEAFNTFGKYYLENKIFIEKDLCIKIEQLLDVLHHAFVKFDISQGGKDYKKDETGAWVESFDLVKEKAGPLINELEDYFRKIVSTPKSDKTKN